MRVLHVVAGEQPRGGQIFASDLIAALQRFEIEQSVAIIRGSDEAGALFEVPVTLIDMQGPLAVGLRVRPRAVISLRRLVHGWKPDVVQAHGGESYKYVLAANPRRRPPVVYRRIGGAPMWITSGLHRAMHALLMRRATMIIAVAESVRRETIRLFGVDPGRIRTIPNAVPPARLEPSLERAEMRRHLQTNAEAVVTLSLGALTWEKDPLAQLEVVNRVLAERSEAIHLFVGDGPMRREIEEEIERRGLSVRCRVLGSRSDVGNILAASDVFLFASRADGMEGMPASVIEAGMSGLPVAGYSVMGVPEVVEDGVTGLLAPTGDVDALTAHVLDLVSNPDRRIAMGSAALERCTSQFDLAVIASRYLELYEELLSR
jgi:L-malate glycosyltransferase